MFSVPDHRAALVVAHPGHELRCYHWVERARPLVFVLTDGSGSQGVSRLASTTRLLTAIGARPGSIYGRLPDRAVYEALLTADIPMFAALVHELADALQAAAVDYVVGDTADGYNPTHDLCRVIINVAVALLEARRSVVIGNFEFSLVGSPDANPQPVRDQAIWMHLDEAALERKLAAAHGYPELAGEVAAALGASGPLAFGTECLRPVCGLLPASVTSGIPFYETYGQGRVARQAYATVVRRAHVARVAEGLASLVAPTGV